MNQKSRNIFQFTELLRPVSTRKYKNEYKNLFRRRVIELLEVIDGSKDDEMF